MPPGETALDSPVDTVTDPLLTPADAVWAVFTTTSPEGPVALDPESKDTDPPAPV